MCLFELKLGHTVARLWPRLPTINRRTA